jgi:hypothetical protein
VLLFLPCLTEVIHGLTKDSLSKKEPHNQGWVVTLCNLESYLCIIICVSFAYIDSFKTLSTAIDGFIPCTSLLVQ